jgi:hypothetical protein
MKLIMISLKRIMLSIIFIIIPLIAYCQTALEEVVRFNVPYGRYFMYHIEANGDLDGDGNNDLMYICCESPDGSGYPSHVYIYHEIPAVNTPPDQVINTPQIGFIGGFGCAASYSGDINGDGFDDLIIGSKYTGGFNTGAVHIYFGGETISEQPDVTLYGEDCMGQVFFLFFGERIISGCDFNGDGFDDLLIYGPDVQDNNDGEVFVFLGGEPFNTTYDLHISGSLDFEFLGEGMATGDINGDGYDDIVVTKEIHNIEPEYDQAIQIYSGGVNLSNTPVYESLVAHSPDSGIGRNILADGDLNGDGFDDIIMSYSDSEGSKLRVIYGHAQFDSLAITDFNFDNTEGKTLLFYCNLDNDLYSDFCIRQISSPNYYGSFNVYKQTNSSVDLNCDYRNIGELYQGFYGYGYLLGDMNHDGYQDFFTISSSTIAQDDNYAKILTEDYVEVNDDTIPVASGRVQCYPIPFKDELTIEYKHQLNNKHYDIDVYDIKGRIVYRMENFNSQLIKWYPNADHRSRLSNGVYLLRLSENGRTIETSKIIYLN